MPNIKVKYIIDENGDRVAPITHIDAVRNSSGDSLSDLMVPEKLGSGIGTCSTSSGTALTVSLTDYDLVQNGFVAVTFENDVPANATLNINSKGAKPIYYKGAAIEADTIKADDTVMFAYDGTNYVVTSLGGGGTAQIGELVIINLSTDDNDDSDLIGASVTIFNTNSPSVKYLETTWQGNDIQYIIPKKTIAYTVEVSSSINEHIIYVNTQSYTAELVQRNINFIYSNVFIDLGLPSGTLWASGNIVKKNNKYSIGNREDIGVYVSYGNIDGHNANEGYDFSDAVYANTPGYSLNGDIASNDAAHDIALARLGYPFRLPKKENYKELGDYCDLASETINGVAGIKFMKKTDHNVYVFFPAGGRFLGTTISNPALCNYITGSQSDSTRVYAMYIGSANPNLTYINNGNDGKRVGFNVRAIK